MSDLTPLKELTHLEELWLSNTPVSDLTPLTGLTHLRVINLLNTPVSQEQVQMLKQVQMLQQALPNCQILVP